MATDDGDELCATSLLTHARTHALTHVASTPASVSVCVCGCVFFSLTMHVVRWVWAAQAAWGTSAPRAAVARHSGEPRETFSDVADDVERPVDAADHADGASIADLVHRGTSTRGSIK